MGNTGETYITERCVRSIRVRGNFQGYITVLTDSQNMAHYKESLAWDPRVIVMEGRHEDMDPTDHNGNPSKYKESKMRFKRFKTLLSEYLNYDSRLASTLIKHVLYVDIDNVVGKDLTPFLQQYFSKITPWRKNNGLVLAANDSATIIRSTIADAAADAVSSRNLNASSVTPVTTTTTEDFSFLSQFKDKGMSSFWHTGIMMIDRQHSGGCLQEWRKKIDQFGVEEKSDQKLLLSVLKNITTYHCWVHELEKIIFICRQPRLFNRKGLRPLFM
jgi:hypothetical protein